MWAVFAFSRQGVDPAALSPAHGTVSTVESFVLDLCISVFVSDKGSFSAGCGFTNSSFVVIAYFVS